MRMDVQLNIVTLADNAGELPTDRIELPSHLLNSSRLLLQAQDESSIDKEDQATGSSPCDIEQGIGRFNQALLYCSRFLAEVQLVVEGDGGQQFKS